MEKTFKDYAHLYLGCDVKIISDRKAERKMDTMHYSTGEYAVCSKSNFPYVQEIQINKVKPLLRPLSDITEEEAIVVSKMATHLHDNNEWSLVNVVRGNGMVKVYFKDKWIIDTTKDYFVKVAPYPLQGVFESYKGEIINQHHYQFPLDAYIYLLKQGFDLFNLIESGIALDKTKL